MDTVAAVGALADTSHLILLLPPVPLLPPVSLLLSQQLDNVPAIASTQSTWFFYMTIISIRVNVIKILWFTQLAFCMIFNLMQLLSQIENVTVLQKLTQPEALKALKGIWRMPKLSGKKRQNTSEDKQKHPNKSTLVQTDWNRPKLVWIGSKWSGQVRSRSKTSKDSGKCANMFFFPSSTHPCWDC